MKRRTVEYICDRCGVSVERPKDLRTFAFHLHGVFGTLAKFDLCDDCSREILAQLSKQIPSQAQELAEMQRDDN